MLQLSVDGGTDVPKNRASSGDAAAHQATLPDQAAEATFVDLARIERRDVNVTLVLVERAIALGMQVDRGALVAVDCNTRAVGQTAEVTAVLWQRQGRRAQRSSGTPTQDEVDHFLVSAIAIFSATSSGRMSTRSIASGGMSRSSRKPEMRRPFAAIRVGRCHAPSRFRSAVRWPPATH